MGGGDGFTVDYDALDQMGDDLITLAGDFDGMRDQMSEYAGVVGSPPPPPVGAFLGADSVADKLDRVAKNWSDDRKEIVEKMEVAAEYANQAATVYRDLDTGLAGEFDGAGN